MFNLFQLYDNLPPSPLPPRIAPCFFQLIPQGQGKVPCSKALRRTTLPAPNVVLTLAVLGATCRGLTVSQSGARCFDFC